MTEMIETPPAGVDFTDQQKTSFFSNLAARTSSAFKEHAREGLWARTAEGNRDWGNVSEHCLVEVARVGIIADLIGLSPAGKKDLQVAAGLHDLYKKQQKEIVTQRGLSFESFEFAAQESNRGLINAGFSEEIVGISGAVGHESLDDITTILEKDDLTETDKAKLAMHYVDDYTINANWVQNSEIKDGTKYNDLDRRMDANEGNERYKVLNEEGRKHFNGETAYQAQRRVGHLVEQRLASLIQEATGTEVDPPDLPMLVDEEIKSRISKIQIS